MPPTHTQLNTTHFLSVEPRIDDVSFFGTKKKKKKKKKKECHYDDMIHKIHLSMGLLPKVIKYAF